MNTMAAPEYSAAPNVVGEGGGALEDESPARSGHEQQTPTVDARVEEGFTSAQQSNTDA